jgi:hypothetical protein
MTIINDGNIDADLIIDLREKEGVKELEGVDGLSIIAENQGGDDESALMVSLEKHPDELDSEGSDDDSL